MDWEAKMRNSLRQLTDEREGAAPMNWAKTPLVRKTYDELKVRLHRKLLDAIDLNKISRLEDARIESDVQMSGALSKKCSRRNRWR
jgi:hypothetical protein